MKVKDSLSEGKASGEDGIPPEVLKRCDLDDIVLDFCNMALVEEDTPRQWSVLNIIPIPKVGDLSLGGNYRGISLSSLVAKAYNKMILELNQLTTDCESNKMALEEGKQLQATFLLCDGS